MSDERARLFVALQLPADVREALAQWPSRPLRGVDGVRLLADADMHVTLCFLGWRAVGEIGSILDACRVLEGFAPAELRSGEAVWLPPRRPRVLAVEFEDVSGGLGRAQAALSGVLAAGGWYAPEARAFMAHVTVARVGKGARLRGVEVPPPPALAVAGSSVALYRSRLSPSGARYEELATVSLAGDSSEVGRIAGGGRAARSVGDNSVIGRDIAHAAARSSPASVPSAPAPDPSAPAPDPVNVVQRFHAEQARAYAGEGLGGARQLLCDDVVWHVPGRSAIAGEHRGVAAVLSYFDLRRTMTHSTFSVVVHGIALIGDRVVQLAGGRATREGREVTWETVGVFRVEGGRIAECWLVPFDQFAFDEIWQ